ncbi:MAG: hypothetical protein CMK32_03120 [Porticoccaceae bacterium]|nr:hypothetical protein [Porticoccaceae bacterium]
MPHTSTVRAAGQSSPRTLSEYSRGARGLILAAEKLFGEHGIDNVSMRQIVSAAGQANHYAVQHHFGTKDALVDAIFTIRMAMMDNKRSEHLAALKTSGDITVPNIVSAIFMPLLEAFEEEERYLFANFTYQILHRNKLQTGSSLKADVPVYHDAAPAAAKLNNMLKARLPAMPEGVFTTRYRLAVETFLSGLNEHRRIRITGTNPYQTEERFWHEMTQIALGIFLTPYPPAP